jgi:hypothetical protein
LLGSAKRNTSRSICGQDFAQLCLPTTIDPRPYCQTEDLAVVSPVKHCCHSGFLVNRADATTVPCGDGLPVTRNFAETIQNDPLPCIIDGQDIICQERYRKFLQKRCIVPPTRIEEKQSDGEI